MGIVNRRNAVVGWLVLKLGKRTAKKKAQAAVPDARTGGALAGGLAALGGALFFWRKKRSSGSAE
jgi:LPXTG-motif cell wall-anchored protein